MTNEKKVALVTGAARGIGRGISLLLAENGITVCGVGTKPADAVSEYETILKEKNPDSFYMQGDISSAADREAVIEEVYRRFGHLDFLINNAGVAPLVRGDLLDMTEESMQRLLDINLKGTFFLSQLAAKRMIEERHAGNEDFKMITLITSISSETSSTSRGEYCISKAGLSMVTKLFADRLAEDRINVYELRPGIVQTDMTAVVRDKYEKLIAGGLLPIRRMGQPEDIGKAVLGLTTGLFAYSTGDVINMDGGFHISRL
ncbi:MAG: 3-ketoacyl-ACP reductase [Clostridia bacterium]|nr:3-ketoacyl-ACP reductase [Clostridia bacterium]